MRDLFVGKLKAFRWIELARGAKIKSEPLAGGASIEIGSDTIVPGASITAGAGTIHKATTSQVGDKFITEILIDLTGLASVATDLDIIGTSGNTDPAHIGQINALKSGTILGGTVRCLEAPAGGDPNISLYAADEGTGIEGSGIATLTETVIFDPAADWTVDMDRSISGVPTADQYLYLVQTDATGTAAAYTAGKFLITLHGYT
jgi:hypothetical protein